VRSLIQDVCEFSTEQKNHRGVMSEQKGSDGRANPEIAPVHALVETHIGDVTKNENEQDRGFGVASHMRLSAARNSVKAPNAP
jgi:hypothetical protein